MIARTQRRAKSEREQELLDEALAESFPASDPASLVQPEGGITGPNRPPHCEPLDNRSKTGGGKTRKPEN